MNIKTKNIRQLHIFKRNNGLKCLKISQNGITKYFYGHTNKEIQIKYQNYKKTLYKVKKKKNEYSFIEWYEKWIQLYKSNLKQNTLKNLKAIFNNYILPKIKTKPLTKLTSQDIQPIFNTMQKQVPRQCTIAYIQLNCCLEQAYKLNIIEHNPCYAVIITKDKGQKGKALTHEEQTKLLKYIKQNKNPINNLILLYLNTGMRCSELCNLKQEDINRETNEIHIKGTKTTSSNRILQTTKDVLNLIPNKEKPFKEWNKDKIEREFKKITTKLNFNKITIHSLRHTFATNCVESGIDMVVIQKWLGHASITMTIDRYAHISEEYKQKELKKLKMEI